MVRSASIGRWISVLYRYEQCYMENELKPYGLGSGQFIFLLVLLHQDGISQEALAGILRIDKGTTARAIQKLERAGYVVKQTNTQDKRANLVYVTEKARQFHPTLQGILAKWTDLLSAGMTQAEKELILELLQKMADNASCYFKGK